MSPELHASLQKHLESHTVQINLPPLIEAINNGWYHLIVEEYYPDIALLRPSDVQVMVATSQLYATDKARNVIDGIKRADRYVESSDLYRQPDITHLEGIISQIAQDRHATLSGQSTNCDIISESR